MAHAAELKEKVVEIALKGNQSQKDIVEKYGVGLSTLQKWLKECRAGENHTMSREKEKRPQDWTPQERLQALLETAALNEEGLGIWCRRNGLHSHHLMKWKQEMMSGNSTNQNASIQSELKRLQNENKQLQKELRYKEKALAEAAALLVLKKKADAIWGEKEDD